MARLASIGTGNFTTAGTWGTINATLYANSETSTLVCPTSYSNVARSAQATPGAITVSHIGVKLANRTGTTGTMTVHIASSTHVEITGTAVTINTADLPVAATADLNGGWVFFKLATPVTLSAATLYEVEAKTSSSTQVSVFGSAATNGMSCALITTTTAAPGAGDDMIVCGEYTGAGTSNSFTVTMDNTASTDFGAASTSLVLPSLAICSKGTLTWGTTAATAYYLKLSGNLIIYSGGTHNMGTTGTPCPRDSTNWLQFDCGANVDFGVTVRNLGTFVGQGQSRTSGKIFYKTLLNTDEAVNSTSLGVADDTGWLDNDEIVISPTNRTVAQYEKLALNGNAGASTLTVDGGAGAGGGLAFTHSGTSPTQAVIILLTRNVRITGASATLQSYVDLKATATIDWDWVQCYWFGSGTANKTGISTSATSGVQNFNYCSFHEFVTGNPIAFNVLGGSTASALTITNSVFYQNSTGFSLNGGVTGTWVLTGCVFIRSGSGVLLTDIGGTFTDNRITGCTSTGVTLNEAGATLGTFSDVEISQCLEALLLNGTSGTITNLKSWRNTTRNISVSAGASYTFVDPLCFGNANNHLVNTSGGIINLMNPLFAGDSSFATAIGIDQASGGVGPLLLNVYGGSFGVASGIYVAHTTGDIAFAFASTNPNRYILSGTTLASTTEVSNQTNIGPFGYVLAERLDGTTGNHKGWFRYGTIDIANPTVVGMTNPVMRMLPNNATLKLESAPLGMGMKAAVANGNTVTVSVDIYKVANYNGNQPRLIVRRNDAMGITADTVLDTATVGTGSTETLSGTTASVTDDGALEFIVDCDGTHATGYCYVDNWVAS